MFSLKLQEQIFNINQIFIYGLLIISIFNIAHINTSVYLFYLLQIVQIYVCLFLLWRFNPFIKTKHTSLPITNFEKKIAFNAGFILLTSNIINLSSLFVSSN